MSFADKRRDALLKLITRSHRLVARASFGRLGHSAAGLPMVKLTTTGRTSGKPRIVILAAPLPDRDRYVLVASKGGDHRHPDWYLNLVANPAVVIEPVGGKGAREMVARTASPAEKADLWPRIATSQGRYAAYQRNTTRDIPVVICEAPANGPVSPS